MADFAIRGRLGGLGDSRPIVISKGRLFRSEDVGGRIGTVKDAEGFGSISIEFDDDESVLAPA